MRRILLGTCGLLITCAGAGYAQGLAEANATMNGMDTLNSGPVSPAGGNIALDRARQLQQQQQTTTPPPGGVPTLPPAGVPPVAPGAAPGVANPAGGFSPAPAAGLPGALPGAAPGAAPGAFPGTAVNTVNGVPTLPGAPGDPNAAGFPGQPAAGQPGATATPTPEPTIRVLEGKRVYDAVTGALLEDAYQVTRPQSQQDKYLDDGVHDNGIQGDGIRGNVETIKNKYIGAVTNSLKNRLINLVRNAENLSPMAFYGYHVMAVDPTTQNRNMPNLLEKEAQRDESLRDWNNKFLADYRIDKNDPRSEFYQLYVPDPPMLPQYPVPPGYVAPQKLAPGQTPVPGQFNPVNPAGAPGGAPPGVGADVAI